MSARPGIALLCLLALLAGAQGCKQGQAGAAPDLSAEDFGSGITLLSTADSAAAASAGGMELRCLSPDELAQSSPHSERDKARDLLLAIAPGGGQVAELRCYLADSGSRATLLGQPLGTLDPAAADRLLGRPGQRSESAGELHLEYQFPAGRGKAGHALTLSFRTGGGCYAARLRLLDAAPPRF